jgi:hypothetical protein
MRYRLRDIDAERKFSSTLTVEALHEAIPQEAIRAVLEDAHLQEQRERKLTLAATVWLLIAMNLFTSLALDAVFGKLAKGLRYIWPDPTLVLPSASALTYRRYQLGARPMVSLFKQLCQPLATPATPGAFRFGLRLMAIDGTKEDLPDTPANAAYWGRHTATRGDSAFPQVQGVYLVECGTHAIVDAGFWPYHTSERIGGRRVLRSITPRMLVMWDRGFHEYDLIAAVGQRDSHVLSRLPAGVHPEYVRSLPDGSYLAYIYPTAWRRRRAGERLLVRIICYTVTDPRLVGYGEEHRLLTTLLDPQMAPALDLARLYHERWESELVVDEIDTHQRLAGRVLRSQCPVGVVQELYGMLLAHYAIRVLMHQAARTAEIDPDRISFVRALEVVRDAIAEFQMTTPEQLPHLLGRVLRDMVSKLLPERRPRLNPRVVKRKMSNFKLKRPEHRPSQKLARPFHESLVLI